MKQKLIESLPYIALIPGALIVHLLWLIAGWPANNMLITMQAVLLIIQVGAFFLARKYGEL